MAPNQRNTLIYENEDVEKVKTYEKKGELLSWERQSTTDAQCSVSKGADDWWEVEQHGVFFTIPISHVSFVLFIAHRLSNQPDPLCQWFSRERESRFAGTAQPDALVFSSGDDALDWIQAWMCRRRMRSVYCDALQER
jgi:hypothetical protein